MAVATDTTRAFTKSTLTPIRARTRDGLESEFLALYRLREEITDTLWQMTRTIERFEARKREAPVGERLSDLRLYDTMTLTRDRLFALECAINGADSLSGRDRMGLVRLADDVSDELNALCAAWDAEREARNA